MVLVLHSHEIVYLKTRKTAGTSVEMLLQSAGRLGEQPVRESTHAVLSDEGIVGMRKVHPKIRTPLDKIWNNHMPAARIRDELGAERWASYTKLACVRNPFDRVISQFHWRRSGDANVSERDLVSEFRDFAKTDWADDNDVVLIDGAFVPDRLIRFEHLSDDLQSLSDATGLSLSIKELPHTKNRQSRRGDLTTGDYYDRRSADAVRTKMRWAFEHCGYAESINSAA